MIYVTGDMHGDLSRITGHAVSKLKKGDTLLVCGDFGFLWDGSKKEEKALKRIAKSRFQIAFVDGVHENYDLLDSYPIEDYAGGKAQKIRDNLYHLLRGEIYEIEGKTIFAFGGGEEEGEIELRKDFSTCWEQAMPSEEEMTHGIENLKKHDNQVDYIITHYPSSKIGGRIFKRKFGEPKMSAVQIYLNQMEEHVSYKHWFFGSYHIDKYLGSLHTSVFSKLVPIEQKEERK